MVEELFAGLVEPPGDVAKHCCLRFANGGADSR